MKCFGNNGFIKQSARFEFNSRTGEHGWEKGLKGGERERERVSRSGGRDTVSEGGGEERRDIVLRGPFIANRCSWEGWSVNFYCHKDELLFIHQDGHKRRPRG